MRKSLKIAGIGCGGVLLLAIIGLGWLNWELRPNPAYADLPELTRDLPNNIAQAQTVFRQRVESRFPVGSQQTSLIAELKRQGFGLRESTAHFQQSSFPCVREWRLWWTTDGDGRIQSLTPRYMVTCP